MVTLQQYINNHRQKKKVKNKVAHFRGAPMKRGVCQLIRTVKPKKPNSAQRKIAKVRVISTDKILTAVIPGQGHSLQKHSQVLIRAGRARDIPGVHYKLIRGTCDFTQAEKFNRCKRRSKFGKKNPKLIIKKDAIFEEESKEKPLQILEEKEAVLEYNFRKKTPASEPPAYISIKSSLKFLKQGSINYNIPKQLSRLNTQVLHHAALHTRYVISQREKKKHMNLDDDSGEQK